MTERSISEGFDLATFKPAAPNYQPSFTIEDQLRYDNRPEQQLALQGYGTFIDNGWDRWHFIAIPGNPPGIPSNVLTLQLQVADVITWWKRIEVYASYFGHWFHIRTLGTANDTRTATVNLTTADAQSGTIKLDFWKAGFLGFTGSYVATQVLDIPSHLGNTVVFLCSRDHPNQP